MRKEMNILGYEVKYNVWYNHNDLSIVEDVEIIDATPEEGVVPDWAKELYDECCDDDYEWADDRVNDELMAAVFDYEQSQNC